MDWGFVVAAFVHHAVVAGVSVAIAVLTARRLDLTGRSDTAGLVRSGALFLATSMTSAAFTAAAAHDPLFAWVRLVSQSLFGEGVALVGAVAGMHAARGQRRAATALGLLAVVLVAVYWEAYHRGPRDLQVRTLDVSVRGDLAPARELRVLHLSDVQTDAVGAHERRAVHAGLALAPDLVILTGDYLQPRLRALGPGVRRDMRALLASLRAPYGVYAVPGDTDDGCALFAGLHVRCLEDDSVTVAIGGGRTLVLTGLDTRTSRTSHPRRLRTILDSAPQGDLRIVFGHSPDYVSALAGWSDVDLALAGHTHGGQIVVPGLGPLVTLSRLPRRYAGGLNDYRGIPLHVSRGIGLERGSAPPIRFFCPPEISLLRIRSAAGDAAGARVAGGG